MNDEKNSAWVTRFIRFCHDVLHSPKVDQITQKFHGGLEAIGIPPPYPDAERIAISFLAGAVTLILYFIFFGKRHRRQRHELEKDLRLAQERVNELDDKDVSKKKEVRIWMDGAFDMMHYGHMNAFRQGKALGTYLVVGVNDDKSITECKGAPPVLNDEERLTAVKGCKFVDAVEPHCPYVMNEEYLQKMIEKHKIDFFVHGDDPCIVNGKNVYETAIALGKYRTIPRTEGVSTSDILGRMLVLHKSHHFQGECGEQLTSQVKQSVEHRPSKFLTTNRMLRLFSVGYKDPPKGARIVYMDGAFDMFHAGHVKSLEKAKQYGDYLIVGVHSDTIVNKHRGLNYPIMNLHERVLSVLGCKFVDDVLIDAPWKITREMIASLNISKVIHGTHHDSMDDEIDSSSEEIRYSIPRELDIFEVMESESTLGVRDIVNRIHSNRTSFEKKFQTKMESENEYYNDRYKHVRNIGVPSTP